VNIFSKAGRYTVNLTVTNDNGTNSKTLGINVNEAPNEEEVLPEADFDADPTIGNAPLTVQFNDLSKNATGWNWDFENDGVIDSIESNPVREFIIPGNYTVNLTATNVNGTASKLSTINVVTQVIPPQSISEIQSSPESTWINWTWENPADSNFDHTEIYLNGTFQANTSAEYFNTIDLQPETDYIIGTRTADIYGNVNETWVNTSAKTKPLPDVDQPIDIDLPVIESVMLFPANTTGRSRMDISANITDNIGVVEVTAGDVQLMSIDGSWQGNITAPSSVGKYSLLIRAKDSAGNTVNTSVPYSVIRRQGSVNIEVLPTVNNVVAGKNTNLAIKVKNSQNIDDTFKVQITTNELPASYRAGIPWFSWTEKTVNLRAKQEVLIPIEVKVPNGTVTGLKLFRVNVNSEKFSVQGSDIGYLVISRPRYVYK
jgi:PKD repeat protein